MPGATEEQKNDAVQLFCEIQEKLTKALEEVDGKAKAEKKSWDRPEGGGGTMSVLRGEVVEKAGVNVSKVYGESYPAIEGDLKDKPFFASGVSTITHMYNPYAPIGHMNVRMLSVDNEKFWFGGGADLTPLKIFSDDTDAFHNALRSACKDFSADAYEKYSKWCDEYFYIKHRKSPRGVGGIFFDYVETNFERGLNFIRATAEAYVNTFPKILQRRKDTPFTPEEKEEQLYWRGRYAEFNLVYDRGTKFGLMTGGNTDAIFVSLPPVVKW